tara:strand:- start:3313 stop:3873 length:561 start_codon:yes stop_codon:yes gene_type:complete
MIITPFFMSAAATVTVTTDTYTTPSSSGGGWTSYSVRQLVPNAELSATATSTSVKVTFRGPASEGLGIEQAFIGQATSGGNAWDFDGNQVQLQVSSSNSFDLGVDSNVQTDACVIALDPGADVIIAVDHTSDTSKDSIAQIADTGWRYYYKEGNTDEADETAPSSFVDGGFDGRIHVKAIEWTSES